MPNTLKKPLSSKAAPKGAAIARVVPVLSVPNRRQVEETTPKNWGFDDELCSMIVGAHKNTHRMVKAFRSDLYARTDTLIGNLADAQKRHAELSGMLELSALLDKSYCPPGHPHSGASLGSANGYLPEHIELERQYVEQVIKNLSGGV